MAQYLQLLLSESMRKKKHQVIWIFSSNREASTQEFFMKKFENRNIWILIYIDVAGIRVNIQDMTCEIQWKILDHLVFTALLQRIGRAGRNKTLPIVSIILIESKHVLSDNIASMRDSLFRNYTTAIGLYDSAQIAKIISTFYKNNF